nr:FAD-dependent oxidoreductase [Sphingomonas sp. Y57]
MNAAHVTWDYIIIGAGSAGCAAAHEIATRSPGAKILIVEAGPADRSPFIRVPAGQIYAVRRHDWGYRTAPDASRDGVEELWPRGKVLGGSSSINGTMYVRGAPADFDRWADGLGTAGASWRSDRIMAMFDDLEAGKGAGGRLHVRPVRYPHPVTRAFVEAAQAIGAPFNSDYNDGDQEGAGYAQMTQRCGLRWSAADAFLRPLRSNGNVEIMTSATVDRILIEDGAAIGIRYRRGEGPREARGRNIVLSAGAIASPQLLMLSGIGDPDHLGAHGIPVVVSRKEVGRNLREHPLVRLTYRMRTPTYSLTEGWLHMLGIGLRYLAGREGPLSNIFEATAFLRSSSAMPDPDIQLHLMPIGYVKGPDGLYGFAPYRSVTVLLNISHPASSGSVRLAAADVETPPVIECALLSERRDVDTLIDGVSVVRDIMSTHPIADLVEEEAVPGARVQGRAEIEAFLRGHTGVAFHPAGTCRMGIDAHAVVDPALNVRGVRNLWIADASIMPDLVSGNTNAVCMMIGAKLGRELATQSPC